METIDFIPQLCVLYQLGQIVSEPLRVSGGFLHQVWRFQTSEGYFCVKQLNADTLPLTENLHNITVYDQFAYHVKQFGIETVTAIPYQSHPYCIIENRIFILFPWVNGEVLSFQPSNTSHAKLMTELLVKLHQVPASESVSFNLPWEKSIGKNWSYLFQLLDDHYLLESHYFYSALNKINYWQTLYLENAERLLGEKRLSHRDLYQTNVIWRDDNHPVIIDWEGMGLIYPQVELFNLAINWAGITTPDFDYQRYREIIDYYNHISLQPLDINANVIYSSFGSWLAWLEFNILRISGLLACDVYQLEAASQQLTVCIMCLEKLEALASVVKI